MNHTAPSGGFPSDLEGIAGSVFPDGVPVEVSRNRMAAVMLECLFDLLPHIQEDTFMEEYRARSIVLGRQVKVIQGNGTYWAEATDIAKDGSLIVRLADGSEHILSSGEISVRFQ